MAPRFVKVPNRAVDMNSRARLACYPRGSFYPIGSAASTRERRITKPNFRSGSRCTSHHQAPLCLCAYSAISIRTKGTFGPLSYSLSGDRPSQTAHQAVFPAMIKSTGSGLNNLSDRCFIVGSPHPKR